MDFWELEASLVYRVSSRTARTVTQRNSALKNQKAGGERERERDRERERERERNFF